MVELVERLCQLIAVVGDAARRVVLASLLYSRTELVELLYKLNLLLVERHCVGESSRDADALSLSLAQDRADTSVCVLDERTGVAVEVDRLLRVEEHVLASVNLEDEVLQCAKTHDACNLVALLLAHVLELAQLLACLLGVSHHCCNQVVCVYDSALAALHLAVRQLHHTVREVYELLAPLEAEAVEQDRKHLEVVVLLVAHDVYHLVDGEVVEAHLGCADVLSHVHAGAVAA